MWGLGVALRPPHARKGRRKCCFWGLFVTLPQQIQLLQSPLCYRRDCRPLPPPFPPVPSPLPPVSSKRGLPREQTQSDEIFQSVQAPVTLPLTNFAIPPTHRQAHTLTHTHACTQSSLPHTLETHGGQPTENKQRLFILSLLQPGSQPPSLVFWPRLKGRPKRSGGGGSGVPQWDATGTGN